MKKQIRYGMHDYDTDYEWTQHRHPKQHIMRTTFDMTSGPNYLIALCGEEFVNGDYVGYSSSNNSPICKTCLKIYNKKIDSTEKISLEIVVK